MLQTDSPSAAIEPLLTARDVAELLGVSVHSVRDWSEQGRIPSFKIQHQVRFRASEIETWIKGQRRTLGVQA